MLYASPDYDEGEGDADQYLALRIKIERTSAPLLQTRQRDAVNAVRSLMAEEDERLEQVLRALQGSL